MNLSDQQLLRIMECVQLRVGQLEKKQDAIDREIGDEVHELRNLLNFISLEVQKRRIKACP